jgi:hypothetical protein
LGDFRSSCGGLGTLKSIFEEELEARVYRYFETDLLTNTGKRLKD